jgi:hypothetical protein
LPFVIDFDIPTKVYEAAIDAVVWEKVKELPQKKLLGYIDKFLKSKGYSITFRDCQEDLGVNFSPDHRIHISSTKLIFSEIVNVVIHEVFHSVFGQLDEANILVLEQRVMRRMTIVQANKILHAVFTTGTWEFVGPLIKTVGQETVITRKKKS